MNDPHVTAIQYEIIFPSEVVFRPPAHKIIYQRPDFDIELDATTVRLLPINHYSSRESALVACEPIVRAWEVLISLELGILGTVLKYQKTEIIDRNPTPGVIEVQLESVVAVAACASATVTRAFNKYPEAPNINFTFSYDAEFLWDRYCLYKKGREPLLSMAYFVLTAIETQAKGRKNAAIKLNVAEEILRKVGELSSVRGDLLTARKLTGTTKPLNAKEIAWIEKAIEILIMQVGMSYLEKPSRSVSMNDLPPL